MEHKIEHICVCICTYKRPKLLEQLLNKLQDQQTENLFTFSIVVVDNDCEQSAQSTVEYCKQYCRIEIAYHMEPEQNISLARNRAVDNARGNYIAFIDDDEYPESTWLLNLYRTLHALKADGVLGPVRPHYPEKCPTWLMKSRLCERPEHKTGTILNWNDTRTGNVILDRKMFENNENRFGPEFGRTGGEDKDFFKRMMALGKVFVWCNEAPVFETVTPERMKKSFYLNSYMRFGGLTGEKHRSQSSGRLPYLAKVSSALIICLLFMPFSLIFGKHLYVKCLTKTVYYLGCITGFFGYVPIRYRQD